MADSSRFGIECLDCGYVWRKMGEPNHLFNNQCPKCRGSNTQKGVQG
jgi:Zn finger protein HypA/HybF involved in hydrogenase expression